MVEVTHYNKNGKKIGYSSDSDYGAIIGLAFFGGIIYVLLKLFGWVTEQITNWQSLDTPYKYVAAFYNYVIGMPINAGFGIWNWLSLQELTKFPNLNNIITVVGIFAYIACIIWVIRILMKILEHFDYDGMVLWFLLILPAILGGTWFLFLELFNWLTATA